MADQDARVSLPKSGLTLTGTSLSVALRRRAGREIVHNLAQFEEIILESRREYHGKWLVVTAVACGVFFLAERSLPVWVCAPFFLLAALIILAWFKAGIFYLILTKGDQTLKYRLCDTPAFIMDFFEQMSANVLKANAEVCIHFSPRRR